MRFRVQVVIEADDDDDHHAPAVHEVHEVAQIDRDALSIDTLGLHLDEAKQLLQKVQAALVDEQVRTSLGQQVACPSCGRARAHKDAHPIVVRTLFGTLRLRSPRWHQCPCQPLTTRTFSPLAATLPERTTPELLYLESKFAGLVSYGLSARLLAETLPIGRACTPRPYARIPRQLANGWRASLVPSSRCSPMAASSTGTNCRGPTCR